MAKIHYFQRYSSVENTVTNNTLQLVARIYSYSPERASQLLTDLTGAPIEIGIEVNQQVRGSASVPDGSIIQRSFKVLVESKVDSPPDIDQLIRHLDSFAGEDKQILILLTREPLGSREETFRRRVLNTRPSVVFVNVTYEAICKAVTTLFQEYEYEMCALVEDYIEYCNDADLLDQAKHFMRIVPCGESLTINKKYGVYFHPSDRGYSRHQYVGIYKDKMVQVIWELDSVFDATLEDGRLTKTLVQGRETADYDDKIVSIIRDARTECGYEIEKGHRFFCGRPVDTEYRKTSPGGIQGARFINLKADIGDFHDVTDLATKLRAHEWK